MAADLPVICPLSITSFKSLLKTHNFSKMRRTCEVPMVLPEPYFSLSDSRDTSCAIRFFSEPVPQLRDS